MVAGGIFLVLGDKETGELSMKMTHLQRKEAGRGERKVETR